MKQMIADEAVRPDGHFHFSSVGHDADEAFAAYAELHAHGSDVARGDGPFHAEVHAWRMNGFLLFDQRVSGAVHSREARASTDGFDHIVLYAVLDGELIGSTASGFDIAGAGDVALADTSRPMRTEARDTHFLTASISRHRLEAVFPDIEHLHGRLIHPPSTLMLIDYLRSLRRRAAVISPETMPVFSQTMIDLLGVALATNHRRAADHRRQDISRRRTVEQFIAANLGDHGLSSATISRETGISRSSLYRLIKGEGGVNRLIRVRRLDGVRSAIENGSDEGLAALSQRFGFSSESHMSRLFAIAYGQPPGAYRHHVKSNEDDPVGTAQRRWRGWMSELV